MGNICMTKNELSTNTFHIYYSDEQYCYSVLPKDHHPGLIEEDAKLMAVLEDVTYEHAKNEMQKLIRATWQK